MTAWKQHEDRVCIALGGRRVLGNRGGNVSDSDENTPFSVECKLGYGRYALREKWLEQARENATREKRPWLIVQRPKYARSSVVTLDFQVFVELVERAGMLNEGREAA